LLHPTIAVAIDEAVTIQGHTIRFATVDLSATHEEIRRQLLRVVELPFACSERLPTVPNATA
jgi:5-methylcytosine-specific restriction enzyme subunit McrC